MARRRSRRGGEEHDGGSERWLLTYSDMITLLMAFFIMMYSMSVLNMQKFNEVAISIRSGFGGMLTGKGEHLLSQPARRHINRTGSYQTEQDAMMNVSRKISSFVNLNNLSDDVRIRREERGLVISMAAEDLLFQSGSTELNPAAHNLLLRVEQTIGDLPNDILVEGHTCPLPIATAQFPSNWELSTARASRVIRFMQHTGIPGWRLSAIGYADTRPQQLNDTEAHRAENRRVDIVILSSAHWPAQSSSSGKPNQPETAKPTIPRLQVRIPKVWPTK